MLNGRDNLMNMDFRVIKMILSSDSGGLLKSPLEAT